MGQVYKYLVVQVGYEYNDEINEPQGSDPYSVYDDEETAKGRARELNAGAFNGIDLQDYCYRLNEISPYFDEKDLRAKLEELGVLDDKPTKWRNSGWCLKDRLPIDVLYEVAKLVDIVFYEVKTIPYNN
jgi:hypothetical protein